IVLLLQGSNGFFNQRFLRKIREISNVPIIIVSAREHEREKVEALDAGADDYLTKPFSVSELLARLRVILRHRAFSELPETAGDPLFRLDGLTVDHDKHRVFIDDEEIHLTPNEYKVLTILVKYQGKVLTHRFITEKVWGAITSDDTQSLRVCMANIRRKLKEDPAQPRYIITEIGVGYRLADE
ncbi:MAG TPA: winged helix-turn-helix domain-containing protein, partial [Clostridiales bacterium]|nr:winged helix-turn-helix domain-containing protein [Clostridiales bacterium]HQK74498.1 winged helix-turn-helix domain-containing protein [Clostridiales bacterium]